MSCPLVQSLIDQAGKEKFTAKRRLGVFSKFVTSLIQEAQLRRSGSFTVTYFGTDRKPMCNFLLVINTNLHSISHRLQVIAHCWSNLHFRQFDASL